MSRLARQLRWLTVGRLAVVAGLALLTVLSARGEEAPGGPWLLGLLGFALGVAAAHAAVGWLAPHRLVLRAHLQLLGDLVLVTGLVWLTGGGNSPFTFLYVAVAGLAAALLGRTAGLRVAAIALVLYVGGLVALALGVAPPPTAPGGTLVSPPGRISIGLHTFGLLAIPILVSHLIDVRHLRQDLADLEVLHRDIIESIPSGLITTDREGRVTRANRAGEEILGLAEESLVGRTLPDLGLVSGAGWRGLVAGATGASDREELVWERRGARRIVGFSVSPLHHADGRKTGYIFIFQDLTEWRQLQEELRLKDRMAAVGELAAGLAHEIGNPLAAISGSVQMLEAGSFAPPQRKLLEILRTESQRLDRTIKGFLRFARPGERKSQAFDAADLLRDHLELLANSPEVREHHAIESDLEAAPAEIVGDPDQISQIFWNVSRNALKAMPEGGTLTVSGRLDGPVYRIRFSDTGHGMSEEERTNLFHPFRSFFDEGSGIGMAIVYRIVQQHAGRLAVASRPGRGTTVTVELPLSEPDSVATGSTGDDPVAAAVAVAPGQPEPEAR